MRQVSRQCGDCQLCCRLLPVRALPLLDKNAGVNCKHQKFHKGCVVYGSAAMPHECSLWSCRWLVNDDTADLSRPDRSHVVIDLMPDFITVRNDESGVESPLPVVQYWNDPRHPLAYRSPELQAYMTRRANEGIAALVRFNATDAVTVFAPPWDAEGGKWHYRTGSSGPGHTPADIEKALGPLVMALE